MRQSSALSTRAPSKPKANSRQAKKPASSSTRPAFTPKWAARSATAEPLTPPQGKFVVDITTKVADCVIHRGRVIEGTFAVGDKVTAVVSHDRDATKKNHTATHLLQWALRQVLGTSVAQQGSLVSPDYLRFDFTCPKALTAEQIKEVESLVREKIAADLPVTCAVLSREQADKVGAMALFGEKYGDEVRVVAVGAPDQEGLNRGIQQGILRRHSR